MKDVIIGGVYRHYKNKDYKVIGIARHSETLEEMVVYQALYDAGGKIGNNALWVRPKSMFFQPIEFAGTVIPRFMFVAPREQQ